MNGNNMSIEENENSLFNPETLIYKFLEELTETFPINIQSDKLIFPNETLLDKKNNKKKKEIKTSNIVMIIYIFKYLIFFLKTN